MEDENRLIIGMIGLMFVSAVIIFSIPPDILESFVKAYGKIVILLSGITMIIIALVSENKHKYCESNYTNRVEEANRYRRY